MTMLEHVASYALSLRKDTIGPDAKRLGKDFFIDCLACIIAGAHARPSHIAMRYIEDMYGGGRKTATVIAAGQKTGTAAAAFINGISSHYHDYDDVLPTLNGHPSAAVLPAALALGEEGDHSGEDVLFAYIAGVEVVDLMARGLNCNGQVHYSRGWHSTQTIGIFGAAAASGILLGLTPAQMTTALSIAASDAAGLQGNFGTMTKAFHAGRAAEKGILAAKMADLNFTANKEILEMTGGYAKATTGELDTAAMHEKIEGGQSVFLSPGMTMKPYPCCKCNHNIIDGVYNLMTRHGFTGDDVEKVWLGVQPFFAGCLKYPVAANGLEGKFSGPYNAALVLVKGRRPVIADFDVERVTDEKLIEVMHKVVMKIDDSIAGGAYANGGWDTKVEITLRDGRVLAERVLHSRGEAQNPLSTEEVLEKLRDCMAITLDARGAEKVADMLRELEKLPKIRSLTKAITDAATETA